MAGFTLDRESIARISQMLRSYEQGMLSPPDIPGPDGSYTPAVQVVKVTGAKDAAGWQPGTIQIWNNASSSFTTGITCHIRASDGSTLATNSIMLGRLSSVESNVPVFIVGPGGLSAEEADGSPSYTGVTKLQFGQDSGFTLSNPSSGTTKIDIKSATTTQAGIVDLNTQQFGGLKSFYNGFEVYGIANLLGGYPRLSYPNNSNVYITPSITESTYQLRIYDNPISGNYMFMFHGANGSGLCKIASSTYEGIFCIQTSSANAKFRFTNQSRSGTKLVVDDKEGITTTANGVTFTGGVATAYNVSVQSSTWMGF